MYLLKYKSQALVTLQQFMKFVSTQCSPQVKVIRSDNALEFLSDPCKKFFSTHGLLHQTSCVERRQQNGRVERKHRQILEMARALRFQANLPLTYWGDCVVTVVYVINDYQLLCFNIRLLMRSCLGHHLNMIISEHLGV